MEFSAGGGALRFTSFIVSCGEESFEAGPIFLLCGETFRVFTVVKKETGLVDDMESDDSDLFKAVGSVAGGGVISAVSTLSKRVSIG